MKTLKTTIIIILGFTLLTSFAGSDVADAKNDTVVEVIEARSVTIVNGFIDEGR